MLLAVFGLSPVGNALIVPLEERFPPWDHGRGAPHGIVVLGGALSPDVSHARNTVALNEAAERLTVTAELAERYPEARIIFSGGSGSVVFEERPEAEFALRLLGGAGRRRAAASSPRTSLATRSRMRGSRATSRSRSRASAGCSSPPPTTCRAPWAFSARPDSRSRPIRSTGAPAAPATCCARFPRSGKGCAAPTPPMREWVGLLAYWIGGQSSELFPGPIQRGECDRAGLDNCRP